MGGRKYKNKLYWTCVPLALISSHQFWVGSIYTTYVTLLICSGVLGLGLMIISLLFLGRRRKWKEEEEKKAGKDRIACVSMATARKPKGRSGRSTEKI